MLRHKIVFFKKKNIDLLMFLMKTVARSYNGARKNFVFCGSVPYLLDTSSGNFYVFVSSTR